MEESLEHEMHAVDLYKDLLSLVEDRSIYLEEYARGMIGEEEQHSLELKKMLKDFGWLTKSIFSNIIKSLWRNS